MLAGMSTRTFRNWQIFYSIEPFGENRAELRHGQQMALAANINRDTKRRPEPYNALEFMNYVEQPPEPELTPEEAFARIDREIFKLT